MPNRDNILRPIVFLGLGRSGTSAATEILATHPEIDNVGEVSPILFDVHWGVNQAMMNMRFPSPVEGNGSRLDLPGNAVREFFLRNFHSDKKAWVIKPIGLIGRIKNAFEARASDAEFLTWCFTVLFECFPEAQVYTIVRDPLSYARSARRYWVSPAKGVANDIAFMSLLLSSGKIQPDNIFKFADFVANPRGVLDIVVANASLDAHAFSESALSKQYAAEQGGSGAKEAADEFPPFSQDELAEILGRVGPFYEPFLAEALSFNREAAPVQEEQRDYADMYKRLNEEFLFLRGQVGGLQRLANQKEEIIQNLIRWNKILEDKTIRCANLLLEHGLPVPSGKDPQAAVSGDMNGEA